VFINDRCKEHTHKSISKIKAGERLLDLPIDTLAVSKIKFPKMEKRNKEKSPKRKFENNKNKNKIRTIRRKGVSGKQRVVDPWN
jgi:hypothetical protein